MAEERFDVVIVGGGSAGCALANRLTADPGTRVLVLEAGRPAGHARTEDVNGYRQGGFGAFDRNIHRGRRISAARAYLHPVLGRPNLTVRTGAFVTGLRLAGRRATGVEYRVGPAGGSPHVADAGEVILCGGSINSPQLLQLAGIGETGHLRSLGIEVVADVPGVGANLQDH